MSYTTWFGSARVLWSEVAAVESAVSVESYLAEGRWFTPRLRMSRTGRNVRLMRFRAFRDQGACDEVCRLLRQHLPGAPAA